MVWARFKGYRARDLLGVEFCDTSDATGLFRKYSAFLVDGEVLPRHLLFSKSWHLKKPDIADAETASIGVEPCLVHAVILYESGLYPNSISTTGAMGLMALQPATARTLSVKDPFDPSANVDGGTRLLKQLSEQFKGDVDLIHAGYNAGPDAVEKFLSRDG